MKHTGGFFMENVYQNKDNLIKQASATNKIIHKKMGQNSSASTTISENHWHGYNVDANGDGITMVTYPEAYEQHMHEIKNWKVQTENGHTHEIPGFID